MDILRLGKRKPLPEALKLFTGSDKLSAAPIKDYFQPLMTWLQKERKEKNYSVGWEKANQTPKPSSAAMKTEIYLYRLCHIRRNFSSVTLYIDIWLVNFND